MTTTKRCAKCEQTKPLTAEHWFKNRARPDGFSGYCKPCQQVVNGANQQRQRLAVIEALGGPVCVRCGFDDVRALTIDHVNGGGTQHRRDAVSMWGVYKHALANPDEYQVLCWNCNYIKRLEEGENASTTYRERVLASPRETLTKPKRWARDFDACQTCETTETPHQSKGDCRNCYMQKRRALSKD